MPRGKGTYGSKVGRPKKSTTKGQKRKTARRAYEDKPKLGENPWMKLVKQVKKSNPSWSLKEVLKAASKKYKK